MTSDIQQNDIITYYMNGDHARAEQLCRQAMRADPESASLCFLLAGILHQSGRPAEALEPIDRGLALSSNSGGPHNLRAEILAALGRPGEAAGSYQRAIALGLESVEIHVRLAGALMAAGRLAEAEAPLRAASRLDPANKSILGELVLLLRKLGRPVETAPLDEGLPDVVAALGMDSLSHADWSPQAAALLREAIRRGASPAAEARAWQGLGHAYAAQEMPDEALAAFARSEQAFRAILAGAPNDAPSWSGLAYLLYDLCRPEEAIACIDNALRFAPGDPGGRAVRGTALAAAGRHLEGLAEVASVRFMLPGWFRGQPHPAPIWDGSPVPGRTVLVTSDDGFGDFLQYCRFVPIAAQHARIWLQVPEPLRRLAAGLAGPERVLPMEPWPVAADFRCPVTHLAAALARFLPSLPAGVPYLRADEAEVAAWRIRLSGLTGLRVGLVWKGSAILNWDCIRSMPAARLEELAGTPGVSFVSMQMDEPAPAWMLDLSHHRGDFADSAALIEALDLVVSVDTSAVHLAGALGRPVWLMNRFSAESRWEAGVEGSAWYPTVRQFRQTRPGDWRGVVARVREALIAEAASRRTVPMHRPYDAQGV